MTSRMRLPSWRKKGLDQSRRYVVSIREAGLGDRLICLCAALIFARRTGRTLVVEWQGSRYLGSGENLFSACFHVGRRLAGVPLVVSKDGLAGLPSPRHPAIWEEQAFSDSPWQMPQIQFPRDEAVELIRSGDVDVPTVVFDACVNDGVVSWQDARSFMAALRPADRIAAAVANFRATQLGPRPLIGLHLRHGNGGDIMGHAPYWASFDDAIDRCCRAVAMARARLGIEARVLLCSDSVSAQDEILKRIPGVIVRRKAFLPPGFGELHMAAGAPARLDDALVDMLLLSRCDVLIRYPPGSFFSFFAAIRKPSAVAPPQTVYDLQIPWDPGDRLSPAVLF